MIEKKVADLEPGSLQLVTLQTSGLQFVIKKKQQFEFQTIQSPQSPSSPNLASSGTPKKYQMTDKQ
jgi:hypothetical protein